MAASQDLTGVWDGTFSYPRQYEPTHFTAVLLDLGGAFSGTTHEVATSRAAAGKTVQASIEGRRGGSGVSFIKVYDKATPGHRSPIHYAGTLSPDGDQIEGEWRIVGNWSGRFLMTRSGGRGAEVEVSAHETAPVA